jgi:F-type H+-transporting ATPase subunit delta
MINSRLAGRYAKSLLDLAAEQQVQEAVLADMRFLRQTIAGSADFANLLKSPVIKADKKKAILQAITGGRVQKLSQAFIDLLVTKQREMELNDIAQAYINLYNEQKGIHQVKFTTAVEVSETIQQQMVAKVKSQTGYQHVELTSVVDSSLIGGFKLEYDNKLIDTSVARDLKDVRKQFRENQYVQQMR